MCAHYSTIWLRKSTIYLIFYQIVFICVKCVKTRILVPLNFEYRQKRLFTYCTAELYTRGKYNIYISFHRIPRVLELRAGNGELQFVMKARRATIPRIISSEKMRDGSRQTRDVVTVS